MKYQYGLDQNDISTIPPHVHSTHQCIYFACFNYQTLHELAYVEFRRICPIAVIDSLLLFKWVFVFKHIGIRCQETNAEHPLPLWMSELTPQADNRLQGKGTDHMVWLPNSQGYNLCICCLYLPKSGVRWLVLNRLIVSTVLQFFMPCSYEEVPITPCVCYIHIHTTIILRHAARIIKSYSWKLNVKDKNNI